MEKLVIFNGVSVLLTTGESESAVQNYWDQADLVISLYEDSVKILKLSKSMRVTIG